MKEVDLNSKEWCDLIFEGRNKDYGAYYLRKTAARRRLVALSAVIAFTVVVILLMKLIHFEQTVHTQNYEVKPIELSSLIGLEESHTKTEEKSPEKKIVKIAPPTIAKDDEVTEEQKELQETNLSPDSIDTSTLEEDSLLLQQEKTATDQEDEPDSTVLDEKNRNAQFQDGKTALLRYIYQNIHYPPAALKQRINGRVVCSFIVNEDGSLSDVALVQGVYIFLDEEVIRVINSMPLWKPAMKDGKPVKVKYVMPVVFKLN